LGFSSTGKARLPFFFSDRFPKPAGLRLSRRELMCYTGSYADTVFIIVAGLLGRILSDASMTPDINLTTAK
jgi:hypothetical protein